MNELSMNYTQMQDAASQLRNRVSSLVTQSFAAAPGAASAAAGANMNYMTSLALVASFAQIASAIKTLTDQAKEHADLIESTAQGVKTEDAARATKDFNADTTFPLKRPGSTHA